jgi:hypothetical protein
LLHRHAGIRLIRRKSTSDLRGLPRDLRPALDEDRATAVRALEEAERLGRRSVDEVRHAVGLLHRGGEADPSAPLPGSLDLPSLIEGFRSAGADVSSTIDGDLDRLPNTVGLAAYRIVQESLTNAVKHAPGAASTVRVTVRPECVQVSVDSGGTPRRGEYLKWLFFGPSVIEPAMTDRAYPRKEDPRAAKLVDLRYFGGLTTEEAARVLDISPATAKRDWILARAWLQRALA